MAPSSSEADDDVVVIHQRTCNKRNAELSAAAIDLEADCCSVICYPWEQTPAGKKKRVQRSDTERAISIALALLQLKEMRDLVKCHLVC